MASKAKTQEFFIGDLDLRASADLTKAAELGPADSIGLMTECKVAMTTNEVKLEAGFPQRTYATAVTSRSLEITGSFAEYTVSNLALLYGDKEAMIDAATATSAKTTTTAATTAPAVDIVVADATGFSAGDAIYIRDNDDATDVFANTVTAVDAGTNTITIAYGVPRDFAAGSIVNKGEAIILGSEDSIPPMTIQVIGVMPLDGEPFIYDIWKATISGTVEVSSSTDNFGNLSYTISPLAPASQEIECDIYGTDPAKKAMIKKFVQGRLSKGFATGSC
jgi:hypothetical protein